MLVFQVFQRISDKSVFFLISILIENVHNYGGENQFQCYFKEYNHLERRLPLVS